MKKILCCGVIGFSAVIANTVAWSDQPLPVNYGAPAPMGAPVKAETTVNTYKNNSNYIGNNTSYSLATGYMGSKIGSNDLGGDENFNGFFFNGAVALDSKLTTWVEYNYQNASEMDFNEVSLGLQYKIFEDEKAYISTGLGIGYAWLEEDDRIEETKVSLKLKYISLPINVEFGYKVLPRMDVFANFGYKWMFNRDADACINQTCVSTRDSDLNVDGVIYKAGIRYNF